MVNLLMGLVCLAGAVALFAYEWTTGELLFRVRGLNISSAWFLLLLTAWNLARWYSSRASRATHLLEAAHQARLRRGRRHETQPPDPTFDFTEEPAPPPRDVTDRPPPGN